MTGSQGKVPNKECLSRREIMSQPTEDYIVPSQGGVASSGSDVQYYRLAVPGRQPDRHELRIGRFKKLSSCGTIVPQIVALYRVATIRSGLNHRMQWDGMIAGASIKGLRSDEWLNARECSDKKIECPRFSRLLDDFCFFLDLLNSRFPATQRSTLHILTCCREGGSYSR